MTGKQKAFIDAYLGPARFNASVAAKIAGYRANSKHSFDSIGSENLTRPCVRQAIDEYWKLSRMNAEEVLVELTRLARGNGKEKLRALALLSQHHGLLDGRWQNQGASGEVILKVDYEAEKLKWQQEADAWAQDVENEVNRLNAQALKIYETAKAKFADKPDAVAAFAYYSALLNAKDGEIVPDPYPVQVEIIPEARRLEPAPIEKMLAQIVTPEIVEPDIEDLPPPPNHVTRCRHGALPGQCKTIVLNEECCPHYHRLHKSSSAYFLG